MRTRLALLPLAAVLAFPAASIAQGNQPIPPPNDMACNGLIIAYGDHPDASPAFIAGELGMSVSQLITQARDDFDCALQK